MKRRLLPFAAIASVVVCALWGLKAKAEPETVDVRAVIPGNAWAYVEMSAGATADWKQFLFGGLSDEEKKEAEKKLQELWDEMMAEASKAIGTDVGMFLKEVDRVHFALLDFKIVSVEREWGATERPDATMVLAVKAKTSGYYAKLIEGDFKEYVEAAPEYRNRKTWIVDTHAADADKDLKTVSKVHLAVVGDTIFVANVRGALEKILDAVDGAAVEGGPITANTDFQRAQKLSGKDAMLLGFVNLRAIMTAVEDSLDRDNLEEYQMIDSVAGQSSLRSLVFYSGLEGRYSWSGTSLFLDEGNEMWSILRQEPGKKDLLRAIPGASAATAVLTLRDPAGVWARARKFIGEKIKALSTEPDEDADQFDRGLSEFETELGTSIDDVLAVIDDEIGWAAVPPEGGGFDERAQVVFVELKDVEKARVVIDNIKDSQFFQHMFEGAQVASTEHQGYTLYTVEGADVPLAWVILDKFWVLAFDPATARAVIDSYKNDKGLENDKQFKEAMKKLPSENSKLIYYNAGAIARLVATAELDPEIAEKLSGDQGIAIVTVEKADEATLMAGCELNSEYYASLVKNALPMLEESRNQAVNNGCQARLRSIGTACSFWVDKFGDSREHPTSLKDLADNQLIPPDWAKCPNAKAGSPEYVYMYPPKGFGTAMDFILAYDAQPHPDGRRGVLRFSSAVEMMDEQAFQTALGEQLKALPTDIADAQKEAEEALQDAAEDRKAALEKKIEFLKGYLETVKKQSQPK